MYLYPSKTECQRQKQKRVLSTHLQHTGFFKLTPAPVADLALEYLSLDDIDNTLRT